MECFDLLRAELHRRGWPTEAPAHLTPGDKSGKMRTEDNARVIRKTLQRLCDEGKQIIVVAHSYGGITASCAVEGLGWGQRRALGNTGGIIMFVYLSAFVIPAGVRLAEAFGRGKPLGLSVVVSRTW